MVEPVDPVGSLSAQIHERRAKLATYRAVGLAYPNDFVPTHTVQAVVDQASTCEDDSGLETQLGTVYMAGRIMQRRLMGKASFVHVQDRTGRFQWYIQRDSIGETAYQDFKHSDIGDIVGASGRVFRTKTGELTLKVDAIRLLTKCLRPLPDKFHGLTDPELRHRKRYLDILMNPESRRVFQLRSAITHALRHFLTAADFMEVETPMMQVLAGGALAKPFITHHHALGRDLYLRIAPELYLKRLVVGGFERVFELNRNFRNEGISTRHNPEFTMLEYYEAYANHTAAMDRLEDLLRYVVAQTLGPDLQVPYAQGVLDFSQPFERLDMADAVCRYHPRLRPADLDNAHALRAYCQPFFSDPTVLEAMEPAELLFALFEETVESQLMAPTLVTGYPTAVSPLARAQDADPSRTERFELFVAGRELANGFSELNDPDDQAERFARQAQRRDQGDEEAMRVDQDYIEALEYGLPPTAGVGIGVDRLVMLLANVGSIRDVILFPHMRPHD